MTWTLDPSERKDWDNAMLSAERVLNATPEKRKCDVTTKEGFRCGLDYGHENAHQIQIGYNS